MKFGDFKSGPYGKDNEAAFLFGLCFDPYESYIEDAGCLENGLYGILKPTNPNNSKNHFVYIDNLTIIDSLPADRLNKPDYVRTAFMPLYLKGR